MYITHVSRNKHLISYLYIFLLAFIGFNVSSCVDKCKDTICNNGYCIKGDCFCEDGFSGTNCEIKESDKFTGHYTGNMECDGIVQHDTRVQINNNFDNPRKILMRLSNSNRSITLNAHIFKDSLFIHNQFIENIDTIVINGKEFYDTTLLLIYPSNGILSNDSILNFQFNVKSEEYLSCNLSLHKNH